MKTKSFLQLAHVQYLTSFNVTSTRLGNFDKTSLTCTKIWKSIFFFTLADDSYFHFVQYNYYNMNITW